MTNFSKALAAQSYRYLPQLAKTIASDASTMQPRIPHQPTGGDVPLRWAQTFMGPGLPLIPMGQPIPSYRTAPNNEPRTPSRIVDTIATTNERGECAWQIKTEDGQYEFQFTPRSYQYPPNVNTTITPRISYGIMSFADIQDLALGTPDVMLCHRLLKREFCGLIPHVVHDDGETCDDAALNRLINYPDGHNPMSTWLGRWFFNGVQYDAPALHMVRDSNGLIDALVNVDGSTIFILIDENGNPPAPPAPAYMQIIYGVPYGFASTEQLWYRPNDLQINSNYGTALVESCTLPAQLLNNMWKYQAAWYTAGTLPDTVFAAPPGWTSDQVAQWLIDKTEALAGHPELRAQFDVWPNGFTALVIKSLEFRKEVHELAKREVMSHAGLPMSEIGETQHAGLGGKGFMEAMGQALFRQAFLPWMSATAAPFNDVLRVNGQKRKCEHGKDFHEMRWDFPEQSIDPEKQAAKDLETFQTGGMTLGEYREARGLDRYGDERDDLIYIAKGGMLIRADGTIWANVKEGNVDDAAEPQDGRAFKPVAVAPGKTPAQIPAQTGEGHTDATEPGDNAASPRDDEAAETEAEKFAKHCGVCPDDDLYFGGTITHVESIPMPHQGANVSEIVSVSKNGLPPRAFVWKPEGDEQPDLASVMGHPQYVAGEAVWWVDRALQFYLVPTTFIGEADGEVGSATMYVSNGQDAKHVEEYAPDWIEKAAVLNWITGEADQTHDPSHPNANYLTHPDEPQRPILYDFFLSFPCSTCSREMRSQFVDAWRGRPLSADILDALNQFKSHIGVWDKVARLVGKDPAEQAQKRMDILLERGMIPQGGNT